MHHKLSIITTSLLLTVGLLSVTSKGAYSAATPTPTKSTVKAKITPTVLLTPTPSAEPTPNEDDRVTEIRNTIKEKVNEIKDKIEKKAFVGTVTEKLTTGLKLDTKNGVREVTTSVDTIIIATNRKEIKLADIKVGDRLIAMGLATTKNTMEGKRLVLTPAATALTKDSFLGMISVLDSKKQTLELTQNGDIQTQTFDSTTVVVDQATAKSLKLSALKEKQQVLVVFTKSADIKKAKTIFVLP